MGHPSAGLRRAAVLAGAVVMAAAVVTPAHGIADVTTAWRDGRFAVDTRGVVERSDIVLDRPNTAATAAMPLGNGTLGAAAWAANGMTVQLNRSDTLPDRKSPGQVVLPGLAQLTSAADYHGRLDLYDAKYVQSGGGMTATTYVRADSDTLVVDVTGADPGTVQDVDLRLWAPRTPTAFTGGDMAGLAETWLDNTEAGATGATFGSLAAVSAVGRGVRASVVDSRTVRVSFQPRQDGTFRIMVAAPSWHGGDAIATSHALLASPLTARSPDSAHLAWWHGFWQHVGALRMNSADGVAQYLENLRTIDLYATAAESRDTFPGSQAGIADLFSAQGDFHNWSPGDYWQWNLRMQVAANLGAGAFSLNDPYFRLYRDNLTNIEQWTQSHMSGRTGICVPETMRFDGAGFENETWLPTPGLNCDATVAPTWNGRTITTGAEVALWVWRQYQMTGDIGFLARNYPLIAESTRFLLDYAKVGTDGVLHTDPSNAHETQWDVDNPTTDIAAEQALFPVLVSAATLLHRDPDLVAATRAARTRIAALPRTDAATQTQLLPPTADAGGQDVIAPSYQPTATQHNTENIGLEPVWPYGLIGDQGPLTALAQRTFADRPNKMINDWSNDPIQAARLGLPADVASTLVGLTTQFQAYPNGFAQFGPQEPYVEQIGVLAEALQESLVQDYDGLLRVAPAWPSGWNVDGTVYVLARTKVDVQVRQGVPVTVAIEAGSSSAMRVRNPWPGRRIEVVSGDGDPGRVVVGPTSAGEITVPVRSGHTYLVQPVSAPTTALPFAPVTGTPATEPKTLNGRTIGLPG